MGATKQSNGCFGRLRIASRKPAIGHSLARGLTMTVTRGSSPLRASLIFEPPDISGIQRGDPGEKPAKKARTR
jgi:hypothetical protein